MMPPGKVQVAGFSNTDTHLDVVTKGARGLCIDVTPCSLSLIVSKGLVFDNPLPSDQQWTLGGYVDEFGGPQVRGKRTFRVVVPLEEEEEEGGEGKTTKVDVMHQSACSNTCIHSKCHNHCVVLLSLGRSDTEADSGKGHQVQVPMLLVRPLYSSKT